MKILILTNHSYMLYRFRRELIAQLQKEHEVVLSMPFVGHEEDFQRMGLRCIRTEVDRRGMNPKTDWKLLVAYRRLLRQEKPDLVLTYSIKPNIYAGLICRMEKIPYCANVQGLGTAFQRKWLSRFVTILYRAALKGARVVFFENQGNADEFLRRRILSREPIRILPGAGIDTDAYPLMPYPENDRIRFLYLGRIMKEKGVDELFSAIRQLHGELGNRIQLDLVGFFDDDYRQEVERLVSDGIAVFHGFQTDPRPYYAAADCIVLPSYHEGLSNVLLEAAATGRPVITSDIPGCRETVDENISGLLCPVGDAQQLYEQMGRMARMPRPQREKMGLAAREKILREFPKDLVVNLTLQSLFPRLAPPDRCTGCTACASICPQKAITMEADRRGFLNPVIHADACTHCGACSRVCPVLNPTRLGHTPKAYAAYSRDEAIRRESTSGGIFPEIAKYVLNRGGVVYGAAYGEDFRVAHICVEKESELAALQGAKYAQSDLGTIFPDVKKRLEQGMAVLFSGTPCQIAGLKAYLRKDHENLITVDTVCHSVPAPASWQSYVNHLAESHPEAPPVSIRLRDKSTGWSRYGYCHEIRYGDGTVLRIPNSDSPYMQQFISGKISRTACQSCPFKGYSRVSDLTLGDFWGIWDIAPEMDDDRGTSLILIQSPRGESLLEQLSDRLICKPVTLEDASSQNPAILHTISPL